VAGSGARLEALRDRVMLQANIARHDRVLDLRAGTGLLTWEALRRAPEGGLWARAEDEASAQVLERDGQGLGALDGPTVLSGPMQELPALLALRGESELRFEAVVGWRALGARGDWDRGLGMVAAMIAKDGRLSLAEPAPGAGSRPSELLMPAAPGASGALGNRSTSGQHPEVDENADGDENPASASPAEANLPDWLKILREAEAEVYREDQGLAWSADDLSACLAAAGFASIAVEAVEESAELLVTGALVKRWFEGAEGYGARLASRLDAATMKQLRSRFDALVGGPARPWRVVTVFASARSAGAKKAKASG
jgi:putative ATPase